MSDETFAHDAASACAANTCALEARELRFGWDGAHPVLGTEECGISLNIGAGSCLAILGPNGVGKTTLLSILAGRLRAQSGEVRLSGRLLGEFSPRERAMRIALLPQIEKLAFNYRVLDFVLMGRTPHMESFSLPGAEDEKAARDALATVGLTSLAERNIGALSGGEFQLVRIARCLAQGAPMLILDEPASMLDPAHSRQIADVLAALQRAGKTIVYTTHDLGLAMFLGGRAVLLGRGRILWEGSADGLQDAAILERCFGLPFANRTIPSALFH